MNGAMYSAPAVQRNLAALEGDGFYLARPGHGHEVAHRPAERVAMVGPAPPPEVVADLALLVLGHSRGHATGPGTAAPGATPAAVATPEQWEALYRTTRSEALPWHTAELEPDLAAALGAAVDELGPRRPGPLRLLDVGAGTGTVALEAARRGFVVVATDVAASALAQAAARAPEVPVTWVRDDILETRLSGHFDLVVDRGCFHLLAEAARPRYVEALARLMAPGALLLLKVHAADEPRSRGPRRYGPEEVAALFAPRLLLRSAEGGIFGGPGADLPRALLCQLVRTDEG
jgi:SAM-dependent methyltransferase